MQGRGIVFTGPATAELEPVEVDPDERSELAQHAHRTGIVAPGEDRGGEVVERLVLPDAVGR